MLSFAPLAALSLLWGSAHALREVYQKDPVLPFQELTEGDGSLLQSQSSDLDLTGLWIQKRHLLGFNVLQSLVWDVIRKDSGRFEAFPIGGCRQSVISPGNDAPLCDEVVLITVNTELGNTSYLTMLKQLADGSTPFHFHAKARAVRSDTGTEEIAIVGSPNQPWVRAPTFGSDDSYLAQALSGWDGEDCRALDGPSGSKPMAYELFFGASASLSFRNIPGITLDSFACVANQWISAHSERFDCIIKNAAKNDTDGKGGLGQKRMEKVLAKLKSVMPQNEDALCMPSVCLGASIVKAPIPSPVPTISLFLTWPFTLRDCNGLNLQDEIDTMRNKDGKDLSKVDEIEHSSFKGSASHGVSFGLFPVPDQAYFAMGTAGFHGLLGNAIASSQDHAQKIARDIQVSTEKLLDAIRKARASCSEVQRRYKYYAAVVQEDGEVPLQGYAKWLEILKAFPEIQSTATSRKNRELSIAGGTYGQIGYAGVSAGIFGGVGTSSRALGKQFKGCAEWKQVIKLWYDSPLAVLSAQPHPEDRSEDDNGEMRKIFAAVQEAMSEEGGFQFAEDTEE